VQACSAPVCRTIPYNQGMTSRTRWPLLLTIIATLALAAVGAGCGGDSGGGSSEAEDVLKKAFAQEVDSADLKIDVSADLEGVQQLDGPLSLTIEGPYKSQGKKKLPLFDWDIKVQGAGQSFAGGLVVTADNAFVEFQGTNYEVGTELFQRFATQIEQQNTQGPQSLKALGVDPVAWLNEPEVKDGQEIGGDPTQVVTGDVDIKRVVQDFFDLLQSPAVKKQLEAQGQAAPEIKKPTDEELKKVEDAIENLRFEANVDGDDVLRRVFLDAEFKVPEGADAGSLQGGKVSFEFVLNDVGNDPQIKAPTGARPLSELTQRFGLQGLGGGGAPGTPGLPGAPGTTP